MNASPMGLTLTALLIAGTAAIVGLVQSSTPSASNCSAPVEQQALHPMAERPTLPMDAGGAPGPASDRSTVASEEQVRQRMSATEGQGPGRAEAIWHLATEPKEQSLPALRQVVVNGSVEERGIALEALGMLAREQGDADGVIREVIRGVIYHGDDDDVLFTARATLDDVEGTAR